MGKMLLRFVIISLVICSIFVIETIFPLSQSVEAQSIPQTELDALIALYNSTNGPGWDSKSGWLTNSDPCNWYGVECENGHVVNIDLYRNNVSGVIPTELGELTSLKILDLSSNDISGVVPSELGNLTSLETLDLSSNDLVGEIPSRLGNLLSLRMLDFGWNNLEGGFPSELGNLTSLETLDLRYNDLVGEIPPELGNLTSLTRLVLTSNWVRLVPPELGNLASLEYLNLAGTGLEEIPPELGNLASLKYLYLCCNLIEFIPSELGNLSSLQELDLFENSLLGSIPVELGNLSSLQVLDLGRNMLEGEIPPELGNLTDLTELWFDWNRLTGEIPTELSNLISLQEMALYGNELTGEIPPELGNLTALRELYLYGNELTGGIPPELGSLTALQEMDLSNNQLTGEIPIELANLSSLEELDLKENSLDGEIPVELGNLTALQYLYLSNNQLTGEIPIELGNLTSLEQLGLSGNSLVGEIPVELGNLTALQYLYLSKNQLTGEIPIELGNLTSLEQLGLDGNDLDGEIPVELSNLTSLEYLLLGNNYLTGEIPPEVGNLTSLTALFLSSNALSGPIPAEIGNLTSLIETYLDGNALEGEIPTEITNLSGILDLGYNKLESTNSDVSEFLDSVSPDWDETQTIPPTNINIASFTATSVTPSWSPISYTADGGFYQVSYATSPGGVYQLGCQTSDKTETECTINGLLPETNYYFTVQTSTLAHAVNSNVLTSRPSQEIVAQTADAMTDSDGDALLDVWETVGQGYDHDGDGTIDLDLYAMGARPDHKDIFVYYDWTFVQNGENFEPPANAIGLIQEAFANAPVSNLDGTTGINIHFIRGFGIPETGQGYDFTEIGYFPGDNSFSFLEFQYIKNVFFPEKWGSIAHYFVSARSMGTSKKSGVSRHTLFNDTGSSDFLITLGHPDWLTSFNSGQYDRNITYAATIMHELGHNLGLGHGGVILDANGNRLGSNGTTFKPNHISVMNYFFQAQGLLYRENETSNFQYGLLDYSIFDAHDLPALNEYNLDEPSGLNGSNITSNYGTLYFCRSGLLGLVRGNSGIRAVRNLRDTSVDWNCDNDTLDTRVIANINGAKDILDDIQDIALSVLQPSNNEWDHLIFAGGAIGDFGVEIELPMEVDTSDELPFDELQELVIPSTESDLEISVGTNASTVPVYSHLTYSLNIQNLGPNEATNVVVRSALPDGASLYAVQEICSHLDGVITCDIGNMSVDDEVTIMIDVTVNATGEIVNIVGVESSEYDPNVANNTSSASVEVISPLPMLLAPTVADQSDILIALNLPNTSGYPGKLVQVERTIDGIPSIVGSVNTSVSIFVDNNLLCETAYRYRIRLHDPINNEFSEWSPYMDVTTAHCVESLNHTFGLYKDGLWLFYVVEGFNRQDVRFNFGPTGSGWWALVGDWNGDGTEGIGLYKDGTFILRSLTAEGVEDNEFLFDPGDGRPVVGDWDGNGTDTVGVFVGSTFYLRNSNSPGQYDVEVATGWADAVPLVGDWNGNGQDGIGIHYQDTFYLGISAGLPDNAAPFQFGPAGWYPIIGDWNNNGRDTIGLFNNGLWRLRNSSSGGPVDYGFRYGNLEGGWQPLSFNSDVGVLNRLFAATVPEPRVPVIPGPDLPAPGGSENNTDSSSDQSPAAIVEPTQKP